MTDTEIEKGIAEGFYSEDDVKWLKEMQEDEEKLAEALELHEKIIVNGRIAAQSLVEMCKCLKRMRDEKLYIELDYKDFDSYCEEKAGIRARQAYTYISTYENLGAKFIEENASLGITKLNLLTQMSPVDRVDAVESGELTGMSTKEIEELVKKTTDQAEQLSLLQGEKEEAEAETEAQSEEIIRLKAEIKELQNKPTEVAVQMPSEEEIQKLREEIKAEIAVDFNEEKEKAVKEAKKTATAEAKEKLQKQIEKAEAEVTNAKAEADKLKAEIFSLESAGEELQKKLDMANGAGQVVGVYFNELNRVFNCIMAVLNEASEEEKEKYKNALIKAFKQFMEVCNGKS